VPVIGGVVHVTTATRDASESLGCFLNRSLESCFFVSLSFRVLVVKGIVICFFI
jgi:hypothetical protein